MGESTIKTPNRKDLNLKSQCDICAYYEPRYKGELLTAHGTCTKRNNRYKMRTERCNQYKLKGDY